MDTNPADSGSPRVYADGERRALLEVARLSIDAAARKRPTPEPKPEQFDEALRQERACFVTLEKARELRGCIGTLTARSPLVLEVFHMARAAAVEDPRFAPVTPDELATLEISISVLSAATRLAFGSEAELVAQLRPGIDGLILRDAGRSGTFLPSVWEKLPSARQFLQHLKRKAGLPADYWSATLTVERYTTECFSGPWWS
jgi:AmmeMemoRadiSam system protein A